MVPATVVGVFYANGSTYSRVWCTTADFLIGFLCPLLSCYVAADAKGREEGYDACNRLQAFGLAHEIELSARQVRDRRVLFSSLNARLDASKFDW